MSSPPTAATRPPTSSAETNDPCPRAPQPVIIGSLLAGWALMFSAVVPNAWDLPVWPLTLGLFLLSVIGRRAHLSQVWVSLPIVTYVGWLMFSLLWSVEPIKTVTELAITVFMMTFGVLIAVGRGVQDLLGISAKAMVGVLLASWVVTILVPSIGLSSEPGRLGAMQGVFNNKNGFGYFTVLSLVTVTCHVLSHRARTVWTWAMIPLCVVSMFASQSRTAITVTATLVLTSIALASLARARRPLGVAVIAWTLTLVVVVATVITNLTTILLLLGRDPTLTGRTRIWEVVIGAIWDRPITGYGWKALWIEGSHTTQLLWAGNYGVPFWHAHNGYLDIAAQVGLVGLLLALGVLFQLARHGSRVFLDRPNPATAWPLLLLTLYIVYNATEVVGFTSVSWVLLVALLSILPNERKGEPCIWPTPRASLAVRSR